ncbi:hypothetical protein GW746_01825 [Candidatus Saccharibacteria bacterium]|nr:hypothetical protein [Candidatus Saccharibacteria bacterium]NCS83133.1 hypothetical protein [Candidatus Saccharibacteria bacterium]
MLRRRHDRGDTIVEVLFAVAVFALVVVGALSLMSQGSATSQRALEITLVRQQMDAQAETLRFLHDSYVSVYQSGITYDTTDGASSPAEEWHKMMTYVRSTGENTATTFGYCPVYDPDSPSSYAIPQGSFLLNSRTARVVTPVQFPDAMKSAETWSQVTYDDSDQATGYGLWIEAVRSEVSPDPNQLTGYVDFHIRSCWDSIGLQTPMHLGTIVRLYEPRG